MILGNLQTRHCENNWTGFREVGERKQLPKSVGGISLIPLLQLTFFIAEFYLFRHTPSNVTFIFTFTWCRMCKSTNNSSVEKKSGRSEIICFQCVIKYVVTNISSSPKLLIPRKELLFQVKKSVKKKKIPPQNLLFQSTYYADGNLLL